MMPKELRLELARWVHSELNPFDSDACIQAASVMAENYKGKQLRGMCRKAKVYAPSTKFGMCSSLINWVLNCRRRGEQVLEEHRAVVKKRNKPKQLTLFPLHQPDFKTVAQRAADVIVPQKKTTPQEQPVRDDSL